MFGGYTWWEFVCESVTHGIKMAAGFFVIILAIVAIWGWLHGSDGVTNHQLVIVAGGALSMGVFFQVLNMVLTRRYVPRATMAISPVTPESLEEWERRTADWDR